MFKNDTDYINESYFEWHTSDSEVLQRVYDREEVLNDGVIVHIKMKGNNTQINEYVIEKVGPEQIRFKEPIHIRGRKKIQIPISSIGYSNKPELINYEIHLEGLCLSSDKDRLIRSMAKIAEKQSDEISKLIRRQVTDLKLAYKHHVEHKAKLEKERESHGYQALPVDIN
ncbi:hypothetical protein V7183_03730 [Bacillus sp. JJ1127]|uniref:hypothetical protein n=1 Tax=Bacillus sp. JJ1127 TaxID=3122952 RepID=UPI002FFFEBCB